MNKKVRLYSKIDSGMTFYKARNADMGRVLGSFWMKGVDLRGQKTHSGLVLLTIQFHSEPIPNWLNTVYIKTSVSAFHSSDTIILTALYEVP